jgi:rhamnogalacturonan endolyase
VISRENLGGFGALTAFWDADPQRELILGGRLRSYGQQEPIGPRLPGRVVAVADVLGDWREELIVTVPGELRIYVSTVPTGRRHTCLMSDPIYRTDVAHAAMGYYQVPMLSYWLAGRAE